MTTPVSVIQMKLRQQPEFLSRLEYLMVTQATVVLAEALNTPHHYDRLNYAKLVVSFPTEYSGKASTMVCGGINITSSTIYDEQTGVATCTATDAAFFAQVASMWNNLAGIETGA